MTAQIPPYAFLRQRFAEVQFGDDERGRRMVRSLLAIHAVKFDVCGTRKRPMGPLMRQNLFRRFSNAVVVCLLVVSSGCGSEDTRPTEPPEMATIEFLTREGCANTATMIESFRSALRSENAGLSFALIDIGTLPVTDPRTGYSTPTVLVDGRDLLGLPAPQPPYDRPS